MPRRILFPLIVVIDPFAEALDGREF